jgi:hypothetical protein
MMAKPKNEFFSEEKNQKTFACCCRGPSRQHKHLKKQKSFASFLQKRRPSCLAAGAQRYTALRGATPYDLQLTRGVQATSCATLYGPAGPQVPRAERADV